jgi:hypothetical protein
MISYRLLRLFTPLNILTPMEEQLLSIYGRKILLWLNEFPSQAFKRCSDFAEVSKSCTLAVVLFCTLLLH